MPRANWNSNIHHYFVSTMCVFDLNIRRTTLYCVWFIDPCAICSWRLTIQFIDYRISIGYSVDISLWDTDWIWRVIWPRVRVVIVVHWNEMDWKFETIAIGFEFRANESHHIAISRFPPEAQRHISCVHRKGVHRFFSPFCRLSYFLGNR